MAILSKNVAFFECTATVTVCCDDSYNIQFKCACYYVAN